MKTIILTLGFLALATYTLISCQPTHHEVTGVVIAKKEIPEHNKYIDKGTLPYEFQRIAPKHILTLAVDGKPHDLEVDPDTYQSAVIGEKITLKKRIK